MLVCYLVDLALILAAFLSGAYRFRHLDKAARIFCLLMAVTFIIESVALYAGYRYHSNSGVYSVSTVIELFILCFYFNYSIDIFKNRGIGIWLGCISVLLGILSNIYLKPHDAQNYYYLAYSSICTITLCLISLLRLYLSPKNSRLLSLPHFWLAVIMLLFSSVTAAAWAWVSLEYLATQIRGFKAIASILLVAVNMLNYFSIAIVFWKHPKKADHE
jgi:hypothetical protein